MKQYSIHEYSRAKAAFNEKYSPENVNAFYNCVIECENVAPIGSKQAWIINDAAGNKWLQSYNTLVGVKWSTGEYESFGRWSVTTSRHWTTFCRMA